MSILGRWPDVASVFGSDSPDKKSDMSSPSMDEATAEAPPASTRPA